MSENQNAEQSQEAQAAGSELKGSVRRRVKFTEGIAGIWDLSCSTCPLLAHTEALGEKPRACVHGIVTNIQGPVPMGTCKHHLKDSLVNESGSLFLLCTKADA